MCKGIVPQTVWACPHLTSLLLVSAKNVAGFELPEGNAALCTSLRQLRISGCTLPGGAFPAALCPALRQLSSLAILGSNLSGGLPPAFSQLR